MLDRTIAYGLDFLFPVGDSAVGASLRDHGEFARTEVDFLVEMAASEAGVLIDVGANIGAIALPFAQQRPTWTVLAIEAHRGLSGVLSANALNNRLHNVEVYNAAAGPARGLADYPAASLSSRTNFGALGFHAAAGATEPVRMLSLDELAPAQTRLVKIDVEGFEPEVLTGAAALLQRREAIWLVEATVQHPEASASVVRTFQQAGYGVFWFYAPFATPRSQKARPVKPATGDANIVALPPGTANAWNLTPVGQAGERRPEAASAYPYLARYGYS